MWSYANSILNALFGVLFLGVCFAYYHYCNKRLLKRVKLLNDVAQQMSGYTQQTSSSNYENINYYLQSINEIKSHWTEYSGTLIRMNNDYGTSVYSTTEADNYFNFSTLSEGIDIPFWQNTGGIFTGLGILGTFAGLTLGLTHLDITSNDVGVLKEGIGGLLQGMNTAFLTSVVGIILAIGFNFYHNSCVNKLKYNIAQIAREIDDLFPRRIIEQWLSDSLVENKKQNEQLASFNTDLAITIGAAINNGMQENLVPLLNNLNLAIGDLSTGGINEISKQIQNNAGGQLKDLANTLSSVQNTIKTSSAESQKIATSTMDMIQKTMSSISENMKTVMENTALKQKEALEDSSNQMKTAVIELNDKLQSTLDKMEKAGSSVHEGLTDSAKSLQEITSEQNTILSNALGKLEDMMQNISTILKEAGSTANSFTDASSSMKNVANNLSSQLGSLLAANSELNDNVSEKMQQLANTAQSNSENISNIMTGLQTTEKAWKAYETHFDGVSGELGKTIDLLTSYLDKYNKGLEKSLEDSLKQFDAHFSSAIGQLGSSVEELGDSTESLNDAVDKMNKLS